MAQISTAPDDVAKGLLQVEGLRVVYCPWNGPSVMALDGVSFEVAAGEVVGILGESGSGKTTLCHSLMGLLPRNALVSGSIRFRGLELGALDESKLERIRGAEVSMIFQEPGLALHPCLRVGEQVADVIRTHSARNRQSCRIEAEYALAQVRLREVHRIYAAYPHELSGGERERVAIALAVASRPSLLLADEPTASLDSTVQAEILTLLQDLNERLGIAILLISHSPAILARLVDRLLVICLGRILEQGSPHEILNKPTHGYTRALVQGHSACFERKSGALRAPVGD